MAKEEAAPAEKSERKLPSKGALIKLGILVLAVLALGAGGFFGWRKYRAWKAAKAAAQAVQGKDAPKDAHGTPKEADEDEEETGDKDEKGAAALSVLVLKPIVNLESQRKNAFLKCELHIVFRDPELGKLASGDKPTIENSTVRSMVLEALSGKSVEEASDPEFREIIRNELKERLNERFAPKTKPGEKPDPKHKKPKKPIKEVLVVDWAIAQ